MTAKEYLRQYEEAERRVKRIRKEYEEQQDMIDAIRSASDFDGMPRSRSGGKSSVEDKVLRLANKAAKLKEAELEAIELRQEVFDIINAVSGAEGEVLCERYINLKRWEEIAVDMNYSWSGIHKLHRSALHLVAEIISA